jgi:glycosyltransferase involved in cell wall biosynthesis
MKRAVHIYLSTFEYESRILKEIKTLVDNKIVDEVLVIATWKKGLKSEEIIYPGIRVKRIKVSSLGILKPVKAILVKFRISRKNQSVIAENHDVQGTVATGTFNGPVVDKKLTVSAIKKAVTPVVDGILAVTRTIMGIVTTLQICYIIMVNKPIFLNIHHVDLLNFAWLKKLSKRMKVIYDTHELETETQGCIGLSGVKRRRKEARFIEDVDYTIVVTPSIELWYRNAYGIKNIVTVRNVPLYHQVDGFDKDYYKKKFNLKLTDTVFLYQGALFKGRGISHLLKSFAAINDQRYSMVFMGYGEFKDVITEYAEKYNNIFYHDPVHPDKILQHTASADVGVALIENVCLSYYYSLANKIFEYTMAEVPLFVSNMVDMADYVNSNKIGWVADSFDIQDIVDEIKKIPDRFTPQLTENIKRAKLENNWEIESQKMLEAYRSF